MSVSVSQFNNVDLQGQELRVRGIVQGVGFRPTVWRVTNELGLSGNVRNDDNDVLIRVWGNPSSLKRFEKKLLENCPMLSRIDQIDKHPIDHEEITETFNTIDSKAGVLHGFIPADAATCRHCLDDTSSPFSRRYRYPFTNCTHCGPRFSIIKDIPYDRSNTSMDFFELCDDCLEEYNNETDRRFQAQHNACYQCGPRAWLERTDKHTICTESLTQLDDVDAVCTLLQRGEIIAIKGIGGFHLACDATNEKTVNRLRQRKQRSHKPFALMAGNIEIIQQYCHVTETESALLNSHEAPIVLLEKKQDLLPKSIAPGQNTLGFMLPYTPLHLLLLKRMRCPIIMTSGNLSGEPQCKEAEEARESLAGISDYLLLHNLEIINRVDDSVVQIINSKPRILRRARGYAPVPIPLPKGFEQCPDVLAMGGELRSTFCMIKDSQAIVSQHIGDLENTKTYIDYKKNLNLYQTLYEHFPEAIITDEHPEYLSSKIGQEYSGKLKISLLRAQHHHAHIASCLTENNWGLNQGKVLGVALDDLCYGKDGTLWGGEFLLADYRSSERLGTFKAVPMLGGTKAILEPWRNTYAHLMAELGWAQLKMNFSELELVSFFESQSLDTLNMMLRKRRDTPLASSCGRLFDAVAAAVGICRENVDYERQAAMELEALIDIKVLAEEDELLAYPFSIPITAGEGLPYIEPMAMWQALLGDLILKTPTGTIAARFHRGLAKVIVQMINKLCSDGDERLINTVALSGGVFQNKTLFELVVNQLEKLEFDVLAHQQMPTNDGGLSLGQAAIAAACILTQRESPKCV